MLRAGVMAAGEMHVDRRVELHARLAPRSDFFGMALSVGGGEFATRIAGASDETRADRISLDRKAERCDTRLRLPELGAPHARDQEVLPNCEPYIAVAPVARDVGEALHLRDRHATDRYHDANPVQPLLLLRMDADMVGASDGQAPRPGARDTAR